MKPITRLMMFGALATSLWSCTNDNTPDKPNNEPTFQGDGYLAVNIQLPTEPGTRANDNFDDGTPNEYAVKDAVLLLFTGANENDATFSGAYNIWDMPGVSGSDQITTTYQKVVKVTDFTVSTNIYGLVMLNYDNVGKLSGDGFSIGTNSLSNESKFSDVLTYTNTVTSAIDANPFIVKDNGNEYIFMTNTVLCSAQGGPVSPKDGSLTTLANLGTTLYPSESEATAAAQSIFVERGLAKVTMDVTDNITLTVKDASNSTTDKSLIIKSCDFQLGNIEFSSYVVRRMAPTYLDYNSSITTPNTLIQDQKYRFVGNGKLGQSSLQDYVSYYRTYWCEDPTYTAGKTYSEETTAFAGNKPLYCFENTFPVTKQDFNNTTRAIVKVVLNDGNNFYIINDNNKIFYSEEDAKSYVISYVSKNPALQEEIETAYGNVDENTEIQYSDYFVVKYNEERESDGTLKVASIEPSQALKDKNAEKTTFKCNENLTKEVNVFVKLTQYAGGEVYYSLLIKHFGDDLTPWEHQDKDSFDASTVEKAYGTDATASQNYLGRYGLVRNNWYDLQITGLKQLGSPVVPEGGGLTPDDNNVVEKYIAFKVNVMKWAKRTHKYELE